MSARLPFRRQYEANATIDAAVLEGLLRANGGEIVLPIPTDLLHVETLPEEDGPSAWVIERYMERGEARQQCTRREPFNGARHVRLNSKRGGRRSTFVVDEYAVEKNEDGEWVFRVQVRHG